MLKFSFTAECYCSTAGVLFSKTEKSYKNPTTKTKTAAFCEISNTFALDQMISESKMTIELVTLA